MNSFEEVLQTPTPPDFQPDVPRVHPDHIKRLVQMCNLVLDEDRRQVLSALLREREAWQTQRGELENANVELEAALHQASSKVNLLEIDVKEWYETFAPYGRTPDAALHVLLVEKEKRNDNDNSWGCLIVQREAAEAWFNIVEVMKRNGISFDSTTQSGLQIATCAIENLSRKSVKKRKLLELVEQLREEVRSWTETARQHCENEAYYRNLVSRIGLFFKEEAFISDDGSVQDEVLCAKVPELVENLRSKFWGAMAALGYEVPATIDIPRGMYACGFCKPLKERLSRVERRLEQASGLLRMTGKVLLDAAEDQ